mmetsp:Transcript_10855/g.16525  ORF Transcript_10855/g.16525 Transcript_10855/m.16525 type:complete len:677 (+) Transcript_10855:94-2124(+)
MGGIVTTENVEVNVDPANRDLIQGYTRLVRERKGEDEIYNEISQSYMSVRSDTQQRLSLSRRASISSIALEQLSVSLRTGAAIETSDRARTSSDDGNEVKQTVFAKKLRPVLRVDVDSGENSSGRTSATPTRQKATPFKTPRVESQLLNNDELVMGTFRITKNGLSEQSASSYSANTMSITSRSDFIEIRTLGSGTAGVVVEALHIPTLTLVAIKMLTIATNEERHMINSELSILHSNLMKLNIVSDRLEDLSEEDEHETDTSLSNTEEEKGAQKMERATSLFESDCPHILGLYDAFLCPVSGMVHLVLEYMDGGSLQDVVDRGGCVEEKLLARFSHQILLGLKNLHNNRQLHRDIKPGNILLNCDGVVKIADFGIAKVISTSNRGGNSFVGTMKYMAPERLGNNPYSYPADIWSFGLTMLSIALGKFPIDDSVSQFWDLVQYVCDEPSPSPGEGFSDEFNDFISLCLQKDPQDRGTAEELLDHEFLKKGKRSSMVDQLDEVDPDFHEPAASPQPSPISLAHLAEDVVTEGMPPILHANFKGTSEGGSMRSHMSDIASDNALITSIRLHHLDTIITKIIQKYTYVDDLWESGNIESIRLSSPHATDSDGNVALRKSHKSGRRGSKKSFLFEPMKLLPDYEGRRGLLHWTHFAKQLHLPVVAVIMAAKKKIDVKYFS